MRTDRNGFDAKGAARAAPFLVSETNCVAAQRMCCALRYGWMSAAAIAVMLLHLGMPAANAGDDVEAFARAPALGGATLSPDGRWVSYIEQSLGRQRVVLRNLRSNRSAAVYELDPARERVRWCGWDSMTLLLCGTTVPRVSSHRAYEESRLYVIDAITSRRRELGRDLPGPVRDQVVDLSPLDAGRVLIQHDSGNGYPQAAQVDLASGRLRKIVAARAPVMRWMSDAQGQVRLGMGYGRGEASLHYRASEGDNWRELASFTAPDSAALGPLAFSADGTELFALAAHEGRFGLFGISLDRPQERRLLYGDPIYDVTGPLLIDPTSRKLLGVSYVAAGPTVHYFDAEAAQIQQLIDEKLPAHTNIRVDRTADAAFELIRSSSPTDPPSLYLLDVRARSLSLLGHQYPQLEQHDLAPMRALAYRARDGQLVPAFLTVPPQRRTTQQLPAIVLPHGGPETRDYLGFDPLVQFLAAQGYAVLQMNFRGSSGYGLQFAAAGAGRWGGVIHNDITDGARWLVEQRIADPVRLCIVGSSFGGFAAQLAAARESQWYACAASYAGISDLLALAQANERLQYAQIWRERLGIDPRALWDNSPLARVRLFEMPVLLVHGTTDAVVPVRQGRRMARALREAGKHVSFVERRDCDHDMTIESCRIAYFSLLQDFLHSNLQSAGR